MRYADGQARSVMTARLSSPPVCHCRQCVIAARLKIPDLERTVGVPKSERQFVLESSVPFSRRAPRPLTGGRRGSRRGHWQISGLRDNRHFRVRLWRFSWRSPQGSDLTPFPGSHYIPCARLRWSVDEPSSDAILNAIRGEPVSHDERAHTQTRRRPHVDR